MHMSGLILFVVVTIAAVFLADSLAAKKGRSRRIWVFITALFAPAVLLLLLLPKLPSAAEPGLNRS